MANDKYAIGVDFGTESGRAVIVRVRDGAELGSAVYQYPDGVIDERLPSSGERLPPEWALQNPDDYISVFKEAVPAALKASGIDPADVIGVGIDFTSCTMMPTLADGSAQVPDDLAFAQVFGNPHQGRVEVMQLAEEIGGIGPAAIHRLLHVGALRQVARREAPHRDPVCTVQSDTPLS